MLFLCLGVVDEENFHNIYTHLFPWGEEAIYQYKNIIHHLFLLDRVTHKKLQLYSLFLHS